MADIGNSEMRDEGVVRSMKAQGTASLVTMGQESFPWLVLNAESAAWDAAFTAITMSGGQVLQVP